MDTSFVIEEGLLKEYLGEGGIVTIPNEVKEIGEGTFYRRPITEVIIPATTMRIGERAFCGCDELKKVTWKAEGKKVIGDDAFCECGSLKNLDMKWDDTEIGEGAFSECESLADKDGFVIINDVLYAYYGDGGDVVIPTGITTIGAFCFKKCDPHQMNSVELESIFFPDSLKIIGEFAFCNCCDLTEVIIPDGVTEIGKHAFEECKYLEKVSLPKSLERIGDYTFSTCNISELELPENLTSIGEGGLMNNRLKEICLPDKIENISKKAFDGQLYASFVLKVKKGSITEKTAVAYTKKSKVKISLVE